MSSLSSKVRVRSASARGAEVDMAEGKLAERAFQSLRFVGQQGAKECQTSPSDSIGVYKREKSTVARTETL
jgi:hypothetical protein